MTETIRKKLMAVILVLTMVISLIPIMTLTASAAEDEPSIIFVNEAAAGSADGSSWDNAYTTLQAALAAAGDGYQIWVAKGTYFPTSVNGIVDASVENYDRYKHFQMKNGVAIYGGFAGDEAADFDLSTRDFVVNETILSGDIGIQGDDSDNSYHVIKNSGADSTAVLSGFTITGGKADGANDSTEQKGGGMYNDNSSPILANVIFGGNTACDGGGMYNNNSSPTLTNVAFSGNTAGFAGGIYNYNSSPTLTNVTFSQNSADSSTGAAGGIFNLYSSPALNHVTFSKNSAGERGGGMVNHDGSSSPTLTNVIFIENTAACGGGMANSGNSTLINVTFSGNSASQFGGGMYNSGNSTLINVTFSGNSASQFGGGMVNDTCIPALINVTFSGNSAGTEGGGMYNYDSSPTIANSIFWGNSGGQIDGTIEANITYSIIQGYTGSGSGNISTDPMFIGIDELRLRPGSPAIDAGTKVPFEDGGTAFGVTTDMDGNLRIVNNSVDIGAYEYQMYTVTASAGSGGAIFPSGAVSVTSGGNQTFTIAPDAGYRISSVTVDGVNQGAIATYTFMNVTANHTISAVFSQSSSGSINDTPKPPEKTITVTETSSELFKNTVGTITAEADVEDAFSNSVEVKVTDTQEDAASFMLSAGDEVFPFDISLYIKGTGERTKPAPGYAVTISLPVPENLLDIKELLIVMHKSDSGIVMEITSRLLQKDGVWYLVFEATEFSPYALVVRNAGSYDETTGVPYYLDPENNKVFVGFAANGRYIAPIGVTVSVMQNGKSFMDVAGHWAAGYIGFVTEREIFVGTGDNTFSPDKGMTRAMFATVIGRLYERSYGEIEASGNQSFTDCDCDAYYGKYIAWASENSIISGYGNGRFGPDDQITREQMAAILYRFADFLSVLPDSMDTVLGYPDADSISDYAKTAAIYCQTTGVIGGHTGGVFAPRETATRAEITAIIQRFVEAVLG